MVELFHLQVLTNLISYQAKIWKVFNNKQTTIFVYLNFICLCEFLFICSYIPSGIEKKSVANQNNLAA